MRKPAAQHAIPPRSAPGPDDRLRTVCSHSASVTWARAAYRGQFQRRGDEVTGEPAGAGEAAAKLASALPDAARVARANRAFLAAAVRYVAGRGIGQFVDIGAGLPTSPNVHECARAAVPGARVAYVDNDPVVVTHARARLA